MKKDLKKMVVVKVKPRNFVVLASFKFSKNAGKHTHNKTNKSERQKMKMEINKLFK